MSNSSKVLTRDEIEELSAALNALATLRDDGMQKDIEKRASKVLCDYQTELEELELKVQEYGRRVESYKEAFLAAQKIASAYEWREGFPRDSDRHIIRLSNGHTGIGKYVPEKQAYLIETGLIEVSADSVSQWCDLPE